jgi:hypothetical protein
MSKQALPYMISSAQYYDNNNIPCHHYNVNDKKKMLWDDVSYHLQTITML